MAKKSGKVERKAELWVEAMLSNGLNKTAAAVAAGYKAGRAAEKAGQRMSQNVVVAKMLEDRRAEQLAAAKISSAEVFEGHARDLRFDPAKLFDGKKGFLHVSDMDRDTRMSLRGLKMKAIVLGKGKARKVVGYDVEVKFPDKTPLHDQGHRIHGHYGKDNGQLAKALGKFIYTGGVKGSGGRS